MSMTEYELREPPLKPFVPRCLCRSKLHYMFGIISPSLSMACQKPDAVKYHMDMHTFDVDMIRYAVYNRKAMRDEWKWIYREFRLIKRKTKLFDNRYN